MTDDIEEANDSIDNAITDIEKAQLQISDAIDGTQDDLEHAGGETEEETPTENQPTMNTTAGPNEPETDAPIPNPGSEADESAPETQGGDEPAPIEEGEPTFPVPEEAPSNDQEYAK